MLDGEIDITTRATLGESSAFGLLYNHYQPKIYRFVYLKVGHREEAEDLTHQVFLHAWAHIGTYTPQGFPFGAWLYRIARNAVIDHYRTKKEHTSLEDLIEGPPIHSEPLTKLHSKLELEKIKKLIPKLKQDYQDVILMRFVEDMSIKEAASALDKSEGAIKLIQHRAINALKKLLTG